MGIKNLNRFLRVNCPQNIRQISLWDLRGKTIVVDASIYMYRFQTDNSLIEGIYQMVALLEHCDIKPIFVFDGPPPPEKAATLKKRKLQKQAAEREYKRVNDILYNCSPDDDTSDLEAEIDNLRKQFVRLTQDDINNVKQLLEYMGVSYYESEGESDCVCAKMVKKKIAFACMSEDMDMFVYGCTKVLRYLSLLKSTVVIYDLKGILKTLRLNLHNFKQICILSGTDYNNSETSHYDLNKVLKYYSKYCKNKQVNKGDFHEWVSQYAGNINYNNLKNIQHMFDLTKYSISKENLTEKQKDINDMKRFLYEYGFVFV